MIPGPIEKYLKSRGTGGPWRIEGSDRKDFAGAVVIPALAESENLGGTLKSLARNPAELLERFLVLLVINHREDASDKEKADNLRTLHELAEGDIAPPALNLGWVDAASQGLELPVKGGGVGLARKIGCDLALRRLDYGGNGPLLVFLDADTLVDDDYLEAIEDHFRGAKQGGAVLPFCHREGESEEEQGAIERYELYLRSHALGLRLAGSPYAFHTVGSAMACRASAYALAGGMNRRAAGEDFYFLQQMAKTAGVATLGGTVVRPSPRPSARTPFGTGRIVARLLGGEEDAVLFYPPQAYRILAAWLSLVSASLREPGETILKEAEKISNHLALHLETIEFASVWERLRRNNRREEALLSAFHGWFDALKSVQLIHRLCDGPTPRVGASLALPELLRWAGLEPASGVAGQLALLRHHQS